MAGRKRIPKDLNDLHGNPGKRKRRKKRTLVQSGSKLGLPRRLSKTVQRHCSNYAKYLKDSGAPIDFIRPMFERYCKCLQMASESHRKMISKHTDQEYRTASKDWKDNADMALKIEKQFEVILRQSSPKKREKKDPLSEFMGKRGIKRVK